MRRLMAAGYSEPLSRVLAARGIADPAELTQDWKGLIAPSALSGTREAAERLALARERGEHVTIVADYDCDGATACALGVRGLGMLGLSVDYFVPDRVTQGYGLSPDIVDLIMARPVKPGLILTVDNGITSVAAAARARALGVDLIVTDHHLPGTELPECACIVNPNLPGCTFPSKALAGVGVIFYVLLALRALLRERGAFRSCPQPNFLPLVDFVSLGTVADVVRLDRNNRILVAQGLKRIRAGKTFPGIRALFSLAKRDIAKASEYDFGFVIGPRINAAGRLASMESGIECLLSDEPAEALRLAEELNLINAERRELQEEMLARAEDLLSGSDCAARSTVSLFDESFNEGIVGLVASRIREKTRRPAIVFARSESGSLKGSGRSVPGLHLRDMLVLTAKEIPDVVERFGGHAMAAGLTISAPGFERFAETFERVVRENADPAVFDPTVLTDGSLAPREMTERLCLDIEKEIWGQGFEEPLFENTFAVLRQQLCRGGHLKLRLGLGSREIGAIFFNHPGPLPQEARLAYRPRVNEFRGVRSVELHVKACETAEDA